MSRNPNTRFVRSPHRSLPVGWARLLRSPGLFVALALFASGCARLPLAWVPGVAGEGDVGRVGDIPALEEESESDPTNPYWPYRIGQIHEAKGEPGAAEDALRVALAREPGHPASLSLLSKIYYDGARYEEGMQLLERAREAGTFPPELAAALALHYEALGWLDEADALAQTLEPRLDWSRDGSTLAYLRLRGDGFTRSQDVARRALDAESSAVNHNNWGIAQLYAGDPKAARKSFLTAAKLDPELPGPLYNLAIVDRFYFFDDELARDWFDRYRRLSDEDPDGLGEILAADAGAGSDTAKEVAN